MPPRVAKDKPTNYKKAAGHLVKEFKPFTWQIIIAGFFTVGQVILAILSPVFLRQLLNSIGNKDLANNNYIYVSPDQVISVIWDQLFVAFGIIIGFYILTAIFRIIADVIIIRISTRYTYGLRDKFHKKLDKLPLSFFDKYTYGEILSRGTNDIHAISHSLSNIVFQTIYAVTMFISVLITMFIVEWRLALISLITVPLQFAITLTIGKLSQKKFAAYQVKTGEMTSLLEENLGGFETIKLFTQEEKLINKFNIVNEEMYKANFQSNFLSMLIWPSLRFIGNVGFVLVCVIGGIINDVGGIVAFIVFFNLFNEPFQMLGQISASIQTTLAGAERLFEILEEEEETQITPVLVDSSDNILGNFEFKNVAFSYTEDQPLITNMNLEVNRGDIIAIVGPTGAGKTTLVNLIMRFYEINSGSITLDGIDIRHYTREALRGSIGMVLQDTWLFKGSIKNNIKYGRTDATDEEIIEAAKAARAHHFIQTLPDGYNFQLSENGENISQGQRQLLTIARAILAQPKILILDEATSSVDTRTEQAIQEVMNEIMDGRTTFIIAHRLSTIKKAKKIVVMDHGDIIETGNHEELLAANGFYAQLYNSQFLGTANLSNEAN
ncbi:MAG: ABC transporter ATP-binding protein [Bacilli bacterium]|jgi:ATP-binding cassette subfamily B multidrug efflux pump